MSLGNRVVKASSLIVLSRIIVNSLSAISIFIMARLLTPEDFGLVAIASVIANLMQSLVQIPVGQALIKIKKPDHDHFNTAWTINLIRTFIMGTLLMLLAVPIANFYEDIRVTPIIWAFACTFIINGLINPKFILFEKDLNFYYLFVNDTVSKLLGLIIAISYAYYTHSYWALVVGSVFTQVIGVFFTYWFVPYKPAFTLSKSKEILSFSIWVSLSHMLNNLSWRFDQLIIGKLFSAKMLGIYNIANEISSLPTREISTPLLRALFPAFTQIADDKNRLIAAYITTTSLVFSVALPLGFGLALVAEPLVFLALGKEWMPAATVIQYVAGVVSLGCTAGIIKALAMSQGKTKILFNRDFFFLLIKVFCLLVGVYYWEFTGLLYGRVTASSVIVVLNFQLVSHLIGVSFWQQVYSISRALISTAFMVVLHLLIFTQDIEGLTTIQILLNLSLQVFTGALIYILVHWVLWLIQKKPEGIERKVLGFIKAKTF